jgi:hypothetical protein
MPIANVGIHSGMSGEWPSLIDNGFPQNGATVVELVNATWQRCPIDPTRKRTTAPYVAPTRDIL